MTTIAQLYQSRCDSVTGKPLFWNPTELSSKNPCLYGDDDRPVEGDVVEALERFIAAQFALELQVGEWLGEAKNKGLPRAKNIELLVQSNVADEARHFKGVQYAIERFPNSEKYISEAEAIKKRWAELHERSEHPIYAPMLAEIAVFLPMLGIMRVTGGCLADMANEIAFDEARHTATNRAIYQFLGFDAYSYPTQMWKNLVNDTLSWILGDMKAIDVGDFDLGLDSAIAASYQLVTEGEARDFDGVCYYGNMPSSLELDNKTVYSRSVAD